MSEIHVSKEPDTDEWNVEGLDANGDGEWASTVFGGWQADRRARDYAEWLKLRRISAGTLARAANTYRNGGRNGDAWGGTNFGDRYSPLTQITPKNVAQLRVAWTFRTGDRRGPNDPTETTDEVTP